MLSFLVIIFFYARGIPLLDNRIIGAIQVMDISGDGIINQEDTFGNEHLYADDEEINEVLIGSVV